MPPQTSTFHLFGLDLRLLWREYCAAWQPLLQSRYFAWLTPVIPVQVLRADGSQVLWTGRGVQAAQKSRRTVEFVAVELPEELVLRKRLHMPGLPASDIAQAVELEVLAMSPFAASDVAWGYLAAGGEGGSKGRIVDVAVTSRMHVVAYIDAQKDRLSKVTASAPEVWVLTPQGFPIVLRGWGERLRERRAVAFRRRACLMIGAAVLLGGIIAISPSLQLRSRSLEAIASYENLQRQTAGIAAQREVFTRSLERLNTLHDLVAERVDLLQVMAALTKTLPDDTYLQSLQLQGLKMTLHGLTADSAALMQTLGGVPGFKDVRAPQAATRMPGANAENFRVEIQLDPALFAPDGNSAAAVVSPPSTLVVSSSSPGGGANSAGPTAAVPVMAASAASSATAPASGASAPRKSRFSSGG